MSQPANRPCPSCGTPVPAGQRFCSNCGIDLSRIAAPGQYNRPPQQIPPYAQPPNGQPQFRYQPPYQQPPQQSNLLAEILGLFGMLFFLRRYRPGYRPRRQNSGCCGCLVALAIMLMLLSIPGYIISRTTRYNTSSHAQTSSQSNRYATPATQQQVTTTQLNENVNYAGIDFTLLNAQQSGSFSDDSDSSTNGVLRLNVKEQTSSNVSSFLYSDVMRLILPDKKVISPINAQHAINPDQGTSRTNWIDFAVPTDSKIDQLTLRLGSETEAQMDIPLSSKANLSSFKTRTASLNATTHYDGMTWTISSATLAWSYDGKQADKGMRHVTISLHIDNPTTHDFIAGFPSDYMRLKAGDTTNPPAGRTTLPTTIAANSAGATGRVDFQVPEGVTSFTLILLGNANASPSYSQATIDFQIK